MTRVDCWVQGTEHLVEGGCFPRSRRSKRGWRAGRTLVLRPSGTDDLGFMVAPGLGGGKVACSHAHLVDSSCHELPQTHERVRGEVGGVSVVGGGWDFLGPVPKSQAFLFI